MSEYAIQPYIVEHSYMGASHSFVRVKRQKTHISTMFISKCCCTHTLKELTKVCNVL